MTSIQSRIVLIIVGIGALLIAIFFSGLYTPFLSSSLVPSDSNPNKQESNNPQVVRTTPENLDQATILPNQSLEIHFSEKLENEPETRWLIEPGSDIKANISEDKKTLKLTPNTPFNLGQSYTLFIKAETKFEGKKTLDREYQYHFKTIEFKGG